MSSWLARGWRAYVEDSPVLAAGSLLLIGAVTIAVGLTGWWTAALAGVQPWWHLGPLLLACFGALVRSRRPEVNLAVAVLAVTLDAVLGGSLAGLLVVLDALYATERFGSPRLRRAAHVAAAVLVVGAASAAATAGLGTRAVVSTTLQVAGIVVVPFAWAAAVRGSHERAATADELRLLEVERSAALERAAEAERAGAVRAERTRMAQELHDSVAGDLSAVVIQASAALAGARDPERDAAALAAMRASGVHALGELRTLIDVLRLPEDAPSPPGARLTRDTASLTRGIVAVTSTGADPRTLTLDDDVDRAAFRILQEALTNVTKHARSPRAAVVITAVPPWLDVEVGSALAAPGTPAPADSGGLGIPGMRARAAAVGGNLEAAVDGERWLVRARLPLRGVAS